MIIRPARLEDARAIAAIHVRSWQVAYQGIVPSSYLDSLSVEERERDWRQALEQGTPETWVAAVDENVLGWSAASRIRDSDAAPSTVEVWAIYVDPLYWRQGIGQLLSRKAEEQLAVSGFSEITLWVFKDNAQAIAFYESNGFSI